MALATAGMVAAASTLSAQGLISIGPGAEFGAEYRRSWQRVEGREQRTGTDVGEWLQLPLTGQLVHPGIATYRLALRPEFRQSDFTGARRVLRGRQLGFGYSADLFQGLPLRLRLNGGRVSGSSSGGLGSETSMRHTTFGATAALPNPYFPLQAGWSRQDSRTSLRSVPGAPAVRTDYGLRSLSVAGSSSKASARYEWVGFDDRLTGTDYETWTLSLFHNFRWGKGSRLESGYERSDQTGALDFQRRDWFERLHLQHTRGTSSDLSYRQTRNGLPAQANRVHTVAYQLGTQVTRGLSAGLNASRSSSRFAAGREEALAVAPRVSLDFPVGRGLRFLGEGSAGVEQRRRRIEGTVPLPVVDEPHTLDATRGFFLNQPDADSGTVQVRHALQPLVYTAGVDFVVTAVGRELRVEVPPGSRIVVGDRLRVSYSYLAGGNAEQSAFTANYRLGVLGGPLRLEHIRSLRQDGQDALITSRGVANFDETSTRLSLRSSVGRVLAELTGAVVSRERAGVTRREYSAGLDLNYPAAQRLHTALGLHWNRNLADGVRATAATARAAASWTPVGRLQLQATLDAMLWRQTAMVEDRFIGASLDAVWQIFAVEAQARYEYSRREGPFVLNGHRLVTRLVRRF